MPTYRTDKYGHRFFKGSKYAYWKEAPSDGYSSRKEALNRVKALRKKGYMARTAKEGNRYFVWVS